jgi:hypothetical protein
MVCRDGLLTPFSNQFSYLRAFLAQEGRDKCFFAMIQIYNACKIEGVEYV